jgi:hypothetical protein
LGDKVQGREGNSPDCLVRSPKISQCFKVEAGVDSPRVGLEAAIPLKKRNSLWVEPTLVEDSRDLKIFTELAIIDSSEGTGY